MTETVDTGTPTPDTGTNAPKGFDAILAGLDEDAAKAVRSELAKANSEAARYHKQLQDQRAAALAATNASKTAEERLADEQKATNERLKALFERTARSEIKAMAAGLFTDPEDAVVHLNPADYVDEDGDVRVGPLQAALNDLLRRKPHLAKQEQQRAPRPDGSQGRTSGGASGEPREVFAAQMRGLLGHS